MDPNVLLAFVHTTKKNFQPRSLTCFFLGLCYAAHRHDYICLHILTNRFYVSHHVTFHEKVFPFSQVPVSDHTLPDSSSLIPRTQIPFLPSSNSSSPIVPTSTISSPLPYISAIPSPTLILSSPIDPLTQFHLLSLPLYHLSMLIPWSLELRLV